MINITFALLVIALVCCIATAANTKMPMWVSVLLVILALLFR